MSAVPSDEEFLAYNLGVVAEFRANRGVVSQPPFPILLLTTTGARTGRRTTVPLGYATDDERVFVVASKAGAAKDPAWFHNLRVNGGVGSRPVSEQYLSGLFSIHAAPWPSRSESARYR